MKYFILRGLLPEPIEYAPRFGGEIIQQREERMSRWMNSSFDLPLPTEGEHCYLSVKGVGRISVFVHNVFDARILIVARSQEKAYALAQALRACATIFLGYGNDEGSEWLIEVSSKPKPEHTIDDIAKLYHNIWQDYFDPNALIMQLDTGAGIRMDDLRWTCKIVNAVLSSTQLSLSLNHLERSNYLFSGYMTSSYYHYHYSRDRVDKSVYAQRKKYLENRTLYDMAFLSAFRSLEALLGTTSLREHDIPRRIHDVDQLFGTSFGTSRWRSYHEFFSTRRKWWSYRDLIVRYLRVRNAVAAHANPNPPFALAEDQVHEIQLLARSMLFEACSVQINTSK